MDIGYVLLAAFAGGVALFALSRLPAIVNWMGNRQFKKHDEAQREEVIVEGVEIVDEPPPAPPTFDRAICNPSCGNTRCPICRGGKHKDEEILEAIPVEEKTEAPKPPPLPKHNHNCPICDYLKGLPKDDPQAKKLQPKERYYYNAVVKENGENKPVVVQLTKPVKDLIDKGIVHIIDAPFFETDSFRLRRVRTEKVNTNKPGADDFWRPKDGSYLIRLLPAAPDGLLTTKTPFIRRKQHYLGGLGQGHKTVQCAKRFNEKTNKWEGNCPVCNHWQRLWANYDIANRKGYRKEAEQYREQAMRCKGMERVYFNVLISENSMWKGPFIWSCGILAFNDIKALLNDDEGLWKDLFDPKKGYSLRISREARNRWTGEPGYPKFEIRPKRDPSPIGDDHTTDYLLANMWDLEAVAKGWDKTEAELVAALNDGGFVESYRKCKACGDRLHTSDEKVQFCKAECLMLQKARDHHAGCPLCGTTKTRQIGNLLCYDCGFQASFSGINRRCTNFPECACKMDKISEMPRGCKCGAKCKLVEATAKDDVALSDEDFLSELQKM